VSALDTSIDQLQPTVRLRFLTSGMEATVRYPVDQRSAADIDEAVSRELQRAMQQGGKGTDGAGVARTELKLNSAPGAAEALGIPHGCGARPGWL
jgi:hypothetical protein